jgi:predicted nucleotidyltransferase
LQGFTEIYEEGLPELNLEGEHQFKFYTLPGIVLLKMIAFDDRLEHRRDDIKDISDILNHFFICTMKKFGLTTAIYSEKKA